MLGQAEGGGAKGLESKWGIWVTATRGLGGDHGMEGEVSG